MMVATVNFAAVFPLILYVISFHLRPYTLWIHLWIGTHHKRIV